jgi:ribonucleoside-triphosphate reductase (formate)
MEKGSTDLKIPVEVYSRVVGYYRPVDQWNKGKQEEFKERKTYKYEGKISEKIKNIQKEVN